MIKNNIFKMNEGSYRIYSIMFFEREDGLCQAYVVADMSEFGRVWPIVIHDDKHEISFRYESNEVMEPWMAGKYSGYAKYVEIRALTGPDY